MACASPSTTWHLYSTLLRLPLDSAHRKDSSASGAGGFIGTKTMAEVENRRNQDHHHYQQQRHQQHPQQHPQLYSPAAVRKGDSSLSGQKGSDTSGEDGVRQVLCTALHHLAAWCSSGQPSA